MIDDERVEVRLLVLLLDRAYDRTSWHGPTLRGALRGVGHETAAVRPDRDRHNIWEIALHAAYWKYVVRRRITGEARGSFPITGSNWFARPAGAVTVEEWRRDLAILADMHRRLRAAVESLRDRDLKTVQGAKSKASTEHLVHGVIFHDIYHAGQVQLIKRLVARSSSEVARTR